MKIAILTLPLHTNYGGILQAYALQTVLERMGHSVDVLQKVPPEARNKFRGLLRLIVSIPSKFARRHIRKFINSNLHLRGIKSLYEIDSHDYDAIIVGSDQIWRAKYFRDSWSAPVKDAFLEFTNGWDIRRISYAASFGLDDLSEFSEIEIKECKSAISRFDLVTLREDSGKKLCDKVFNKIGVHVLDPTMLLTKQDYINLIQVSNTSKSSGNLFCSILDPSDLKRHLVEKIAAEKNLKIFYGIATPDKNRWLKHTIPSIESWLRGFMDADLVITDSFHACVFSIIFGKPFVAIGNTNRGATRFTSLLNLFGLEGNLIAENSLIYPNHVKIADPILLEKYRQNSLTYLNI